MDAFDGLKEGQITHGYWGNHTSSIDWCEVNYAHTPYVAEFINTLTNVPTICLGLYGAIYTILTGVHKRHALCYLGLSFIGIGSFGFHASLKWEWQLLDELPMIYVVSYATYLVFDTRPSFAPRFGIPGISILVAWDVLVTLSYMYLPNPVYHQVAFAGILLTSVGRNFVLIQKFPSNHPGRNKVIKTAACGLATFATAFAFWNVDNLCCDQLRSMRKMLGVWGFLLEGHGYWHLMTGYGSFLAFTASTYLQLAMKTSPDAYYFDDKAWFPVTKRIAAKSNTVVDDNQFRTGSK